MLFKNLRFLKGKTNMREIFEEPEEIKILIKSAEEGNLKAQYELGKYYYEKYPLGKDYLKKEFIGIQKLLKEIILKLNMI